jgi:hypothetical protein
MTDLPTGTVTFLFTDLEASTREAYLHRIERWIPAINAYLTVTAERASPGTTDPDDFSTVQVPVDDYTAEPPTSAGDRAPGPGAPGSGRAGGCPPRSSPAATARRSGAVGTTVQSAIRSVPIRGPRAGRAAVPGAPQ